MKKLILILLPGLIWSQAAPAPAPAAAKPPAKSGVEAPLNRAPVSKEVLHVKLPRAVEMRLDNGLTVLILEDHRLPVISMNLELRSAGALREPAAMTGLATATASMLREGAGARNSKQIAEAIDRLAASIGASAGQASVGTNFTMSGLAENFDQWFPLAVDILLHPTFPADEWAKLKQRQLVSLRSQRTSAGFLVSERFSKAVYGDHPASIVSATPATLEAITPEAMKKWHDERYVPQTAILGIAGDVTPAQIMPKLKAAFAAWKSTELKAAPVPPTAPAGEKRVFIVNRPGSVQTNLAMGNIAIDRRSPDYVALVVMNNILGGGSTARLFNNLREDKGYTYGAYSSVSAGEYAGPWSATSEVRTDVTEGAMREFFNEFNRMRDEKVPAAELEEKKRSVVARFALSLESPQSVLSLSITRKVYGLPEDYWDTYPAQISAVTAEDIQRVARKYLNLDNIQIIAVGDEAKIKPVLEKYGKVAVYDVDGKLM
ncbi:MAG: pitrilysin family protein [Candidatus Solibacter sp.]